MGTEQSFTEKRRHSRVNTSNMVEYALFNGQRKKIDQGIGRTLNLSQSGALLETERPLEGSYILLMTLDLEGKKVQVKGRVANTRQSEKPGYYLTGVEFIGSKDEQINAIVAFVKAYNRRKHAEQQKQSNPI
jgi:c-di-GMP-binding flagellar brake protein YcgR